MNEEQLTSIDALVSQLIDGQDEKTAVDTIMQIIDRVKLKRSDAILNLTQKIVSDSKKNMEEVIKKTQELNNFKK